MAWKPGPALASADELEIVVTGRGGHASTPQWATDPVPTACELVLALQSMVTRTVDVFDPAVLTIAEVTAGTTHNVIPETARLFGTLRAVLERTRHSVWERIRTVADGIAAAHGCTASVEITEGYPVTVNDAGFAEFVAEVADEALGGGRAYEMPAPVMGALRSFSRPPGRAGRHGVPRCVPTRAPQPLRRTGVPLLNMVLHEDVMSDGIALHAAVATAFLANGGVTSRG